jgi:hypothetical protein
VAEMQASDGDRAPARVTVGGRYDLEFVSVTTSCEGTSITKIEGRDDQNRSSSRSGAARLASTAAR